jgi:hypothetical protein
MGQAMPSQAKPTEEDLKGIRLFSVAWEPLNPAAGGAHRQLVFLNVVTTQAIIQITMAGTSK